MVALARIREASLIEKRTLVEGLIPSVSDSDLPPVVAVLAGEPLTERRVALSRNQIMKILSSVSGRSVGEVGSELRRLGSIPSVAESILGVKKQRELVKGKAGMDQVLSAIQGLSQPGPKRSARGMLARLLSNSNPAAAGVILAILLRESPSYVARSVLADALAKRFGANRRQVLSLAAERGWRAATLVLLAALPASPETLIRGSGDREERRQRGTHEGYD